MRARLAIFNRKGGVGKTTTVLNLGAALAESPAQGRDVFSHAPDSRGARDYEALLEELLSTGFWEG